MFVRMARRGRSGTMIQIKMGARRLPKEFAQQVAQPVFWAGRFAAGSPRWCARQRSQPRRHLLFGDLEHVTMRRCLAALTIAASLFAPVAHANDALEAKVRAYVPVVSLAKVCDIRINDSTLGDHRAMLEAVKYDPNANKLAYRLHYETQTAYIKARDGGQRAAFCKDFDDTMAKFNVPVAEHKELFAIVESTKGDIVGAPSSL